MTLQGNPMILQPILSKLPIGRQHRLHPPGIRNQLIMRRVFCRFHCRINIIRMNNLCLLKTVILPDVLPYPYPKMDCWLVVGPPGLEPGTNGL
jgi:hypothetical protein